ncbi:MAG TPA: response regulator transcription factor, partial [Anaerolineales bacterium]|nr:response regulator transcription factor [Anaerolineales bacterium]
MHYSGLFSERNLLMKKYQIGILEDHIATIMGYQTQLQDNPRLNVTWTASFYSEVEPNLSEYPTDLLIMDVGVRNDSDSTEPFPIHHAIPKLLEMYPDMQIVVISMHNRPALIKATKNAGASGYILKDDVASFKNLDQILLDVLRQEIYFSPEAEKLIANPEEIPSLTKRQGEILSLLASAPDLTTREMAEQLHISPSTVRNHLSDIYLKLGV